MKKICLFIAFASITTIALAQHTRINLYSSYVFDDSYSYYYNNNNFYDGKVKGGYQWGVGLEYAMHDAYGVELLYLHQDTHAPTSYNDGNATLPVGTKNKNFDLSLNYIMVGGLRYAKKGKVEGYGGLMLGMAIADVKDPVDGYSASATKFAWGLRLGANIWASDRVGIKLQTQLLSVVQQAGGGFYFGTGGAGVGLSTYSSIYQFVLGGGLTFRLGK